MSCPHALLEETAWPWAPLQRHSQVLLFVSHLTQVIATREADPKRPIHWLAGDLMYPFLVPLKVVASIRLLSQSRTRKCQ